MTKIYVGKPCKHGHSGERYVSTRACTECQRAHGARQRIQYPDKCKEYLRRHNQKYPERQKDRALRSRYGVSLEDFNSMCAKQLGKCACCEKPLKHSFVDHCHWTGKVRGILCPSCNSALGLFKDNIATLENAIQYLSRAADGEAKRISSDLRAINTDGREKRPRRPSHSCL